MAHVDKDGKSPDTTSDAYDRMVPLWNKIDTVLTGTEAMRAAGVSYLPQHEQESEPQYAERLFKATLFNLSEITLDQWVGRPFSDLLKIDENMPEELAEILRDNVDQQGNNINVFARHWFRSGLAKAFSHVYVDMPRVATSLDADVRTKEDDKDLKPYMTFIRPENLIFAHVVIVDGQEILTHIRIRETQTVMNGFAEETFDRIRAVTLQHDEDGSPFLLTEIYETDGDKWYIVDVFVVDFPLIPLVSFYVNREGLLEGKPPLLDLVNLNINHWQSNSDHDVILTVAQFPILAASGVDAETKIVIGPKEFLTTEDPQGRWYYVEHSGKAIEAGAKRLMALEDQMANYGAEFLKKRPGSITATARALDSVEATSPLQDAALRFNDALNTAIKYMAMWLGIKELEKVGDIKLITDFGPEVAEQAYLQEIGKARERRDLSRKQWIREMQRNGGLSEDFDDDLNQRELEAEINDITGGTNKDIDPNAPPDNVGDNSGDDPGDN